MNIFRAIGLQGPQGPPGPVGPVGPIGMPGRTGPVGLPAVCQFCFRNEAYTFIISRPICKECGDKLLEKIDLIFKFQ